MKFNEVEKSLKEGKKVKLASWKNAYWHYDKEKDTIMNHFEEDGSPEVPIAELFPHFLIWMTRDTWEVVGEESAAVPSDTYSFGDAINFLKAGKKVARKGWNGKNQYIQIATGISYKAASGEVVNCEHDAIGNKAIAFVGTSGVQMGWLASQADMLAEDWYVVE